MLFRSPDTTLTTHNSHTHTHTRHNTHYTLLTHTHTHTHTPDTTLTTHDSHTHSKTYVRSDSHLNPLPLSSRNLLANSFNCDCRLGWLGDWLRSRKIVTGNPRCQRPAFLKEIPLQDVALPDFRCEEGETSCRADRTG